MLHSESYFTFQAVTIYSPDTRHQIILRIFPFTLICSDFPIVHIRLERVCLSRFKSNIRVIRIISIEIHSLKFRTFVFNLITTVIQCPNTILHGEFTVVDFSYYCLISHCKDPYCISFNKLCRVITFSCTCLVCIHILETTIEHADLEAL